MIVKIVPSLRYGGDGVNWDVILLDADECQFHSYRDGRLVLSEFDVLADGPAHIYGEKEPRRTHEPEMLLEVKQGNGRKIVWVRGECDIFVMNENGKTIDRYQNC